MSNTCKNCFQVLAVEDKFCANCGQKTSVHRLSLHEIGHDVVHYFRHTDANFFNMLKRLLLAPGKLVLAYINGARKSIINPVTLLFICGTVMYFSMSLMHYDKIVNSAMKTPESMQFETAEQKAAYARFYNNGIKANEFNNKYAKPLLLLLAPFIAFFFWLFYIKARFNYAEHLVAYMFFSSITTLFSSLVFVPLATVLTGTAGTILLLGTIILQVLYLGWGYYQLLGYSTKGQLLKCTVYAAIVIIISYLIITLISAVYIFLA